MMKASLLGHDSHSQSLLARAEETIELLTTRVATLERLLQSSPPSEGAGPAGSQDHDSLRALRDSVRNAVDPASVCAVVSRGDDRLLLLGRRAAWHFPRLDDGSYAGYYPGDDEAAVAHLEYVRSCGADVLLFPDTQMWWLDHYRGLAGHLEENYTRLIDEPHCRAYSMAERKDARNDPRAQLEAAIRQSGDSWGELPSVLDLTGSNLVRDLHHAVVVPTPPDRATLPFEDSTMDFVIVPVGGPGLLAEASRVAREAVCVFTGPGEGSGPPGPLSVNWQHKRSRRLPSASVIIPTFNGAAYMRACLQAIGETVPASLDVEIIVADDCSTDETISLVRNWQKHDDRVGVHKSARNRGFIDTCNGAAKTAQGDVLVFLNNDTVPLDGWLSALLRTFCDSDHIGAAGGKLLFPDGRLQEAGGVIFRDGAGANFGKWDPKPGNPLYSYLRDVDYCSGALLATPRALFEDLKGFDKSFRPAYYEDADYCFQVRQQGLRVVYQPESSIIHVEGGTSGTNLEVGPKRAQIKNRERFLEKWRSRLESHPQPPNHYDLTTWYRLAYGPEAR
jgi:GT2 family glycosyltransferase